MLGAFALSKRGELTITGSGITAISHITIEAQIAIRRADLVYHVVADVITRNWIEENSKAQKTLTDFYVPGQLRRETYANMASSIADAVRKGLNVCAVFYGHPGVFVNPSHTVAKQLREEGYKVIMQPGISAEDCMFADLGFDPATDGCTSIEATQLVVYNRQVDVTMPLIIWQIGMVGDPTHNPSGKVRSLDVIIEKLRLYYPGEHQVCVYEAALYSVTKPRCDWAALSNLGDLEINGISTLYIPKLKSATFDEEYLRKTGLAIEGSRVIPAPT